MKNRTVGKKKRTPTEQARHDKRVMSGLLVVIAVLLALVIALLPDGRSDQMASGERDVPDATTDRPTRDEMDNPEADTGDSVSEPEVRRDNEAPVTETYPSGEEGPAPTERVTGDLWWLPLPEPGVTPGTLYVVLDDAGGSLEELEPFLGLNVPLTIAVLPQLAYSAEASLATVSAGQEVILHQPMEPVGSGDPGPGAISASTSVDAVPEIVRANLMSVPGAIGVNNHMGSRITQDEALMRAILETLERDRLFFLDSRTSAQTVAGEVALELNLPFVERHVFLDNVRDQESMLEAFKGGLERARSGQDTILIGHVTVPELALVLETVFESATEQGYEFGHLSDAVAASAVASRETP